VKVGSGWIELFVMPRFGAVGLLPKQTYSQSVEQKQTRQNKQPTAQNMSTPTTTTNKLHTIPKASLKTHTRTETHRNIHHLQYTTMTVGATEPLALEEQLFLQRLMASHVMDHTTALKVFQGDDLDESLPVMNQQLTKGFGLEVATVILNKTKYHAIINTHADDIAKLSEHFNAHERGLIRLIFQCLVEEPAQPRSKLMNLRGDLEEPLKLTLTGAEHVVEMLLEEQWLRVASAEEENRRESMQALLELSPRTYLELSHLLVDMGMEQETMPQFLFHRL
jgi:hypothetical protein